VGGAGLHPPGRLCRDAQWHLPATLATSLPTFLLPLA
jgi:hypothetical protein